MNHKRKVNNRGRILQGSIIDKKNLNLFFKIFFGTFFFSNLPQLHVPRFCVSVRRVSLCRVNGRIPTVKSKLKIKNERERERGIGGNVGTQIPMLII